MCAGKRLAPQCVSGGGGGGGGGRGRRRRAAHCRSSDLSFVLSARAWPISTPAPKISLTNRSSVMQMALFRITQASAAPSFSSMSFQPHLISFVVRAYSRVPAQHRLGVRRVPRGRLDGQRGSGH